MNAKQERSVYSAARELAMKLFGSEIPEIWGGGTIRESHLVIKVKCSNKAKRQIIAKFGKSYKRTRFILK